MQTIAIQWQAITQAIQLMKPETITAHKTLMQLMRFCIVGGEQTKALVWNNFNLAAGNINLLNHNVISDISPIRYHLNMPKAIHL